jgi:hypothetical protein
MLDREPTWQNQLAHARQLLADKGVNELQRHAMVSLHNRCFCKQCFCCAALFVLTEVEWRAPQCK